MSLVVTLETGVMARIGLSEAAKKRVNAGWMLLAGKGCNEVALAVGVANRLHMEETAG